ncbi:hypothetical protein MKX41_10785 [Paenibacillus sp. FSL R5-0475]|uniref:hypothetical protein n=1 Tax=Paenibacillus sp. FSL R5-0475 TaxID=2921643 RepID=UPI0030FC723A
MVNEETSVDGELTIEEGENIVEEVLSIELAPYILGIQKAINTISTAVSLIPTMNLNDVSISLKVVNSLLMKSINDLRVIWLLSTKGYSIQAATVASSLYESAFNLAYIGNSDSLARIWNNHNDTTNTPFGSIKKITSEAIKKQSPENFISISNVEYSKYSQLCMAKHANPINQKNHVYKYEEGTIIADSGPEASNHSIRVTCFSIVTSLGFIGYAIVSYVNEHLASYNTAELVSEFDELGKYHTMLYDQFQAKWGIPNTLPEENI